MKRILFLILAAASTLPAQTTWFHAEVKVGLINREVDPTTIWLELDVTNQGKNPGIVLLTAYRYDGREMVQLDHTVEPGEKYTFKIEARESDELISADGLLDSKDKRLRTSILIRASTPAWDMKIRQLKLHGDQISTAELGGMVPVADYNTGIIAIDLPTPDVIIATNVTGQLRAAFVCRGTRQAGCLTESTTIRLPPFGSTELTPPYGSGDVLIVNGGHSVIPARYYIVPGTTGTYNVKSGITFGDTIKDQ
jgi:hypothetical protein